MEWSLLKRCCFFIIVLCGLAVGRHCDHRHFWDAKNRVCQPCARCPMNEIIRKPCGRHSNTVCGPFREFNFFNQLGNLDSPYPSYEYESFFDENSSRKHNTKDFRRRTNDLQNEPVVQKDDGEYWRNLAYALIGVVCVLIFVATVVVLVACRKLHETAAIKRPEEEDDDDSGYVVIRAIRPPNMVHRPLASSSINSSPVSATLLESQQNSDLSQSQDSSQNKQRQDFLLKGTYRPKRWLLNYDADDVFESEDSSGSRTSRKFPLQPIPERSVSSGNGDDIDPVHMPV